jgi:hypothetical protein
MGRNGGWGNGRGRGKEKCGTGGWGGRMARDEQEGMKVEGKVEG